MKYLAGEDILVLHHEIIEKTGGLHGVREVGLFLSAVERPRMQYGGRELYKGIFRKAAAYCDSLARHHVFTDGNKRTAFAAAPRFLYLNGYEVTASNANAEVFTLRVVREKLSTVPIAVWFKRHSRRK